MSAMTIHQDHESAGIMPVPTQMPHAIALAGAIVDKRLASARAFPRSISQFKHEAKDLLQEDVETAASAEYVKKIGGGTVRGPSVRLAEIAAMCWGNLDVEVSSIEVGDRQITVRAVAWDLQRNYRQEGVAVTTIVQRNGQRYADFMIETATLATASKAKRNAILNVIPRAYINDLLEVAKAVRDKNAKPLEARRRDLVEYFARAHRVTAEQICEALNVKGIDDIGTEEFDTLHGIATALKEGSQVSEFFTVAAGNTKAEALKDKLKTRQANGTAKPTDPDRETVLKRLDQAATDLDTNADGLLLRIWTRANGFTTHRPVNYSEASAADLARLADVAEKQAGEINQ